MIVCIYVVEMCRPGCSLDAFLSWFKQRQREESSGRPCEPLPKLNGADPDEFIRTWKGPREARDWDRLKAFKKRDGWGEVSSRREFVTVDSGEMVDRAT